jgi:hypothetical protein
MAEGIELLADPTRRRIVALIAAHIWHPADIAEVLGLSRSAVSRQLRILAVAGLLEWHPSGFDGRSRIYLIPTKKQGRSWRGWPVSTSMAFGRTSARAGCRRAGYIGCATSPGSSASTEIVDVRATYLESGAGRAQRPKLVLATSHENAVDGGRGLASGGLSRLAGPGALLARDGALQELPES